MKNRQCEKDVRSLTNSIKFKLIIGAAQAQHDENVDVVHNKTRSAGKFSGKLNKRRIGG